MRRLLLAAALLGVMGGCAARAHAEPPTKVSVIEDIYPGLHARELARPHPSWNHLRRAAADRWWKQHPVQRAIEHPTPDGNRYLARRMFGSAYPCAAEIIEGETGGTWRHDVAYGFRYGEGLIYSGLPYGLGQANPGTKMLRYGADAASNPATQLTWLRAYANERYGGLCAASAHWTPVRSW